MAKRSEEPTPADTPRRFFLTGVIPVSESLGMYLQANKPLFPHPLSTLSEEPFAPAAEHEAAPEGPIKMRKKRLLKPPVHLYQFFTIFSLISSTFSFGRKKLRALLNFSV